MDKDEDWVQSTPLQGVMLNDWTIFMSYVYGSAFKKPRRLQIKRETESSKLAPAATASSIRGR
ncbi:hypothetical protein LINPERPRIM_LOCUS2763 [Linum perenne]